LFLTGCVSMSAWYAHQGTKEIARCRHWGWGWLGTPLAVVSQYQCENTLEQRGFVEVSSDSLKSAVRANCATAWPNDVANQAICAEQEIKRLSTAGSRVRPPTAMPGATPTGPDPATGCRPWMATDPRCTTTAKPAEPTSATRECRDWMVTDTDCVRR
jgi:hypothetical protein